MLARPPQGWSAWWALLVKGCPQAGDCQAAAQAVIFAWPGSSLDWWLAKILRASTWLVLEYWTHSQSAYELVSSPLSAWALCPWSWVSPPSALAEGSSQCRYRPAQNMDPQLLAAVPSLVASSLAGRGHARGPRWWLVSDALLWTEQRYLLKPSTSQRQPELFEEVKNVP